MKRAIWIILFLAACNEPACSMSAASCKEMCTPRMVERFDKDGCFCEGVKKP